MPNEAKNFIEYLTGERDNPSLQLHYRAWKEGHKIFQELRAGNADDGVPVDGKARDLLKAVYLKPLRDAEREMSSGRSSRISQILLNHSAFRGTEKHPVLKIMERANNDINVYFQDDEKGKQILHRDAYSYAEKAIKSTPDKYSGLLSMRFKYVFIDEYQDCDEKQREVLDSVFDPDRCAVMKIGDPDQAIFNSIYSQIDGWIPKDGFLPDMSSCRYGQEIADFICKLKKNVRSISTTSGKTGLKPVLIVFDNNSIGKVIETFSQILDRHGINERDGVYKAIGAIKKDDTVGKKIGSYWTEFDSTAKSHEEYRYWGLIDIIVKEILDGRIYIAEQIVRKLLCRVFHYVKGLNYTLTTMKQYLDTSFKEIYRHKVYEILMMNNVGRMSVHNLVLQLLNDLFPTYEADIFSLLPEFFTDNSDCNVVRNSGERNIWIDVASGRKIVVDTIHSVKGETHDATLYLETDFKNKSDLERISPFWGAGVKGDNILVDRSRKLAYVGMSRPRKLLCVAMCAETYEKIKCKSVFSEWEIEDLCELLIVLYLKA